MAKNIDDLLDDDSQDLPRLCSPGEVRELFMKALGCSKNTYYDRYYPYLTWRKYHEGYPKIPYKVVVHYIKQAIKNPSEEFRYIDRIGRNRPSE